MRRRRFLETVSRVAPVALSTPALRWARGGSGADEERPNIVWIIAEDMSPNFGCYGETTIRTPNVDRLAAEGVRFSNAFITCPVCSPSRSAMITGSYQTTIGAHQHRSGRGTQKIHLPEPCEPVPGIFQRAGYYASNGYYGAARVGKTDYNFEWDGSIYDGGDWSGRKPGQPFFAQIQLRGGKLRNPKGWSRQIQRRPVEPSEVRLPPYYPDHAVIRQDWADYLNAARHVDHVVGQILKQLKDEGIADNTYVIFITDHGISHARGKQFLYEEGIHIPFIVRGPGLEAGSVRDDLIVHIDMAATSLAFAGIGIPDWMQSRDLFATDYNSRDYVVSARDRCDETVEHMRCVRTQRFKYIRNYYPDRPHLQPNAYKDHKPIVETIRQLHREGKLNRDQSLVTASTRAPEELYDLQDDPWELSNLAGSAKHQSTLRRLRKAMDRWIKETGDRGEQPEPAAMYDSDMKVYVDGMRPNRPERAKIIEDNIAQMKRWAAEGK